MSAPLPAMTPFNARDAPLFETLMTCAPAFVRLKKIRFVNPAGCTAWMPFESVMVLP